MKKVLTRQQVKEEETWDLKRLYKTEELYHNDLLKLKNLVELFKLKFEGNINNSNTLINAIKAYEEIYTIIVYTSTYQSLYLNVDQRDLENQERSGNYSQLSQEINLQLTFFDLELSKLDPAIINEAIKLDNNYKNFLEDVLREKPHDVSDEVKKALKLFNPTLNSQYKNYNNFKFGDMNFKTFKAEGKDLPISFTLFENEYQYDLNHEVRRNAFNHFYDVLGEYENGFASNYEAHVLKEKAFATLKNFETTTDYLLFGQKVSLDMYHRQIDLIMKHLSKPMQDYAKLIKDIYKLDKLTYEDLHLPIDPEFEKDVTIQEARDYAIEAFKVYGSEYQEMTKRAFDERWIDFPQNLGKSTGGFASSPYKKGSFILLNWNNQMNETFVLAHEIGHAGHFHYAHKNQNIFNSRSSTYFIEAPSTMNELVMADYFNNKEDDKRFRRWVLSNLISRTYYHNFVTHLLEAAFQKEVYELIDSNGSLSANVLNNLKLKVLKEFWGDAVEIDPKYGRTWMRQPHYFMGLYPYTYSAGLTISTTAFNRIKKEELTFNDFIEVLKAGGSKTPKELAMMLNIDLETDKPLLETISYIDEVIKEIIKITKDL